MKRAEQMGKSEIDAESDVSSEKREWKKSVFIYSKFDTFYHM